MIRSSSGSIRHCGIGTKQKAHTGRPTSQKGHSNTQNDHSGPSKKRSLDTQNKDRTRQHGENRPFSPSARVPDRQGKDQADAPQRQSLVNGKSTGAPALDSPVAVDFLEKEEATDAPLLCGLKPVLELLEREPDRVDAVWLRKGRRSPESDRLLDLCRDAKVRFYLSDGPSLDRLCAGENGNIPSHQGVVARLFAAGFVDFTSLLEQGTESPLPLILALDQVRDPGNAGTLARTLHAMGGAGLVIPRHNGVYLGAGARRSAAGALEQLPVAKVMNLARALDEARDAGWRIYGAAAGEGSANAFTLPLYLPGVLVLGSEEKGLRPQVAQRCHELVRVPMLRPFDSLNVAQAGAVLISCFARGLPAFTTA